MSNDSLWVAFTAAQSEFQAIVKSATGARASQKYAPLDVVIGIVRPVLNAHGLALTQVTHVEGETLYVRTVIVCSATGETHESIYPAGLVSTPHQQLGAGVTYARRYSLLALLGVAPENEDDDGEKAGVAGSARAVNPNSSAQLKKSAAWKSFTDKVQHYMDSRDLHGLQQWYGSEAVQKRIAKWPEAWREQAEELFIETYDALCSAK